MKTFHLPLMKQIVLELKVSLTKNPSPPYQPTQQGAIVDREKASECVCVLEVIEPLEWVKEDWINC